LLHGAPMTALLHIHSGLRYLVLLAALGHLVVAGLALLRSQPLGKGNRIASSIFMGLLHTQVLVGLVYMVAHGFYPALAGHLAMMLVAAAVATVVPIRNRKRPTPSAGLALAGTAFALLCIVIGIIAIGRSPLGSTAFGG